MGYIPAKKIERLLKKEGISVNGYDVVDCIRVDSMNDDIDYITEGYEFSSTYELDGVTLTFYGEMVESYRKVSPDQEVEYYYTQLDSCKIEKDGKEEKVIEMDVYWDKLN